MSSGQSRRERRKSNPEILKKREAYLSSIGKGGVSAGQYGFGVPSNVSTQGGGYGYGNPGAVPATGQQPTVNPFIIPKSSGLSVISQTFPNNYYLEWDLSAWRAACEQAIRMGYSVSWAAMCSWTYESSSFVQSLFRELEVAVANIPIIFTDKKGNKIETLTDEICSKKWFRDLFKEGIFSKFWGFSAINIDPVNGKIYKYPMQDVDPINRLLKSNTFAFFDGLNIEENANLLFFQPSTSYESFLGWMQPITRAFIQMNTNNINWMAAGRRLAFPIMTVGYPQDDTQVDRDGNAINVYRNQAEDIIKNSDPQNGLAYPYTIGPDGSIVKAIDINFADGGGSGAGQRQKIYVDFNNEQKQEIREMILLSTLTSSTGSTGSYALGSVHMEKYEMAISHMVDETIALLNDEFLKKIKFFYKNFPEDIKLSVEEAKEWDINEIGLWSNILRTSGKQLTTDFFTKAGLSEEDIEDVQSSGGLQFQYGFSTHKEPESIKLHSDAKPKLLERFKKKNNIVIGREYYHTHGNHSHGVFEHLAAKRPKPKIDNLERLRDQEIEFAYQNPDSKSIFTPMYSAYNGKFFEAMKDGIKVEQRFKSIETAGWWDQYMVNAFQFSAAKNRSEMKLLQQNIYDENKQLRSFSEFKNLPETKDILDKFNGPDYWLRVEYETASHGSIIADKWQDIVKDKDINPYWVYVTVDSPCEICEPLDGMVFDIEDESAQDLIPQNHFNCYCTLEPTDEGRPASEDEINSVKENVPEQFRGNVGSDGIFPREGSSYYDVLPNANDSDSEMYELSSKTELREILVTKKYDEKIIKLVASEWGQNDPMRDIYFQNREFLLTAHLSYDTLKKLGKKTKGIENIRDTIEHPSEIWGTWVDTKKQKEAQLQYIKFDGKNAFIVTVVKGKVVDAIYRQHTDSKNLRRKGVLFVKS